MSCCWHVCGRGALSETKLHLLIWPKCSLNLGDPETFLFSMEHSLGNATKNRFPEGLVSLIAKHGLKQTVSFPWQLKITWPATSHCPADRRHQGEGVLPFISDGKLCLKAPQPCFPFPSTQKEWPDQVSRMQTWIWCGRIWCYYSIPWVY